MKLKIKILDYVSMKLNFSSKIVLFFALNIFHTLQCLQFSSFSKEASALHNSESTRKCCEQFVTVLASHPVSASCERSTWQSVVLTDIKPF